MGCETLTQWPCCVARMVGACEWKSIASSLSVLPRDSVFKIHRSAKARQHLQTHCQLAERVWTDASQTADIADQDRCRLWFCRLIFFVYLKLIWVFWSAFVVILLESHLVSANYMYDFFHCTPRKISRNSKIPAFVRHVIRPVKIWVVVTSIWYAYIYIYFMCSLAVSRNNTELQLCAGRWMPTAIVLNVVA